MVREAEFKEDKLCQETRMDRLFAAIIAMCKKLKVKETTQCVDIEKKLENYGHKNNNQ